MEVYVHRAEFLQHRVYAYLVLVAQCTFGALSLTSKLAQSALVLADVLVVLLLDELDEVLHDSLIKVLTCSSKFKHLENQSPYLSESVQICPNLSKCDQNL